MTRKENLLYEMKNLLKILERYLKVLDTEEIDETDYLQLNDGIYSVSEALRYYFDEDYYNTPRQITILLPDDFERSEKTLDMDSKKQNRM